MKIYDFNNCKISDRNGIYGGMAGSKEGIIIDNEYWFIKYPQSTRSMQNVELSYTSSPISEYLGSHIFKILGYDVHETLLGIRNDKVVVACKDFCPERGSLTEMRTIKNIYNKQIEEMVNDSIHSTGDNHSVDLNEIELNLAFNPILSSIEGAVERFWECAVIDVLINNNDRNNGNWGLLFDNGQYLLAPIYDNGSSFYNKIDENKASNLLNDPEMFLHTLLSSTTVYSIGGKRLNCKTFMDLEKHELDAAVIKLVPLIENSLDTIFNLIDDIPVKSNGFLIMPEKIKKLYKESIQTRFDMLIKNKYILLCNNKKNKRER